MTGSRSRLRSVGELSQPWKLFYVFSFLSTYYLGDRSIGVTHEYVSFFFFEISKAICDLSRIMYIYRNKWKIRSKPADHLLRSCPEATVFCGASSRHALYPMRVICHLRHQPQVRSTPKRLFSHRGTHIVVFFFWFYVFVPRNLDSSSAMR